MKFNVLLIFSEIEIDFIAKQLIIISPFMQNHSSSGQLTMTLFSIFQEIVDGLKSIGHVTQMFGVGGSVVCGVAQQNGKIYANSDFRKAGEVDGF